MRYFYFPGTCSLAGMAALEICGASYVPAEVMLASDRAELRAVSPEGKVPVLEADGFVITDTVAILYWLARRFPDADLLPSDPAMAAITIGQLAWFGNVFHIIRRRFSRPMMFSDDPATEPSIRAMAAQEYGAALKKVDGWMADPAIPIAVQCYALNFYNWAVMDGREIGALTSYRQVVDRLCAREDVGRALTRHHSPLIRVA